MQHSYRRTTIPVLLATLAALAGCDGAVSMQQGGPNINAVTPEPSPLDLRLPPEIEDDAPLKVPEDG